MTEFKDMTIRPDLRAPLVMPLDELDVAMVEVGKLDLTMVTRKIMDAEEGQGWDEAYAAHVEDRYRRFLVMIRVNPAGGGFKLQVQRLI